MKYHTSERKVGCYQSDEKFKKNVIEDDRVNETS